MLQIFLEKLVFSVAFLFKATLAVVPSGDNLILLFWGSPLCPGSAKVVPCGDHLIISFLFSLFAVLRTSMLLVLALQNCIAKF
jgi:hypothetical protein